MGDDWNALQLPVWAPFVWWPTLAAYAAITVLAKPATCTPALPCQPHPSFSIVLVLLAVAAAMTWWWPRWSLAAGLAGGAVGAWADPAHGGRWLAVGLLLLAAAGLVWMWWLRLRQAHLATESGFAPAQIPWPTSQPPRLISYQARPVVIDLIIGALGLLLLTMSIVGYRVETASERTHLSRAVTVTGTVATSGTDDEPGQLFAIGDPLEGRRPVLIEPAKPLPLDSTWPILLDPQAPAWARLVSEPASYAYWFGWGLLGALGLAWTVTRILGLARARRLTSGPRGYWARVSEDAAEISLDRPFQAVAAIQIAASGIAYGGTVEVPVLIRGPLCDGAFVSVATKDRALGVVGPVRAVTPWRALPLPRRTSGRHGRA